MIEIFALLVALVLYGGGYVHGRGHRTISALFSSEAAEKETFRELASETEEQARRLGREVDRLRRCLKLVDGLLSSGEVGSAQAQLRVAILHKEPRP